MQVIIDLNQIAYMLGRQSVATSTHKQTKKKILPYGRMNIQVNTGKYIFH